MLSYQVLEYYKLVLQELNKFKESMNFLLEWENEYSKTIITILPKILSSNTTTSGDSTHYIVKGGQIIQNFDNVIKEFKTNFKFVETLTIYGSIKQNISQYKSINHIEEDYINIFFNETDSLFKVYQEFIQDDKSKEKAVKFGQEVCKYKNTFNTCQHTYQNLVNLLTINENIILQNTNYKELTIQLLNVEYNLQEFSEKLNNINEVYTEIGNLLIENKKSIEFEKLKIVKIESGSLFSDIIGNTAIIGVLALFLTKTIQWAFNKFTTEGKIGRHTELSKSLKEEIDLGEEMKKYGYDISESKQTIEKTYNAISKNLLNIARSSAKIKVDDEVFSIKDNLSINYLQESTKLYLQESNDKNDIEE